jgi:hypothetical protein
VALGRDERGLRDRVPERAHLAGEARVIEENHRVSGVEAEELDAGDE